MTLETSIEPDGSCRFTIKTGGEVAVAFIHRDIIDERGRRLLKVVGHELAAAFKLLEKSQN
jgi:hypothetical protein